MNGGTLDARLFKHARNLVGAMLGAAEHKYLLHFGVRKQQLLEKSPLAALVDAVKFLMDAFDRRALRSHLDPHRIRAQNGCGKLRDVFGHGRAKEQVLPILREQRHHLTDIVDESHVEHAVSFVKHEEFQSLQGHSLLVDEIEQATRCRDQNVYTAN